MKGGLMQVVWFCSLLSTHSYQPPGMELSPGVHVCPSTAGVRVAAMVIGAPAGPTETAMTVMVSLAPRMPPEWLRLGSVNPCVLRAS